MQVQTQTATADIQQKIVAKRFDEALDDLTELLREEPDDVDALYMAAVCHRYRREFDQARQLLTRLKSLTPENGRVHQEEGHVARDAGNSEVALAAYARACRFNPALTASWRQQKSLLLAAGRTREAAHVDAQLKRLDALPPALLAVMDLIGQGKLLKAEDICRQFLAKVPHHVEAMRLLADIGLRFGVLDDAETLLSAAHTLEPDNVPVHIDLIQALRKRQKFARALEEAKALLASAPDNVQFQSICAIEHMQTGDYDNALALFDSILERLPNDAVTLTSRGHAEKTRGQYDAAVAAYRHAIAANPQHGEAYYSLANLKIYSFGDDEVAAMHEQEADLNLSAADRTYLRFALGKAYEDRGDYETSMRYYLEGNALKKAQSSYKADRMRADLEAQAAVCSAAFFAQRDGGGCQAPDPIFVVGLPRVGSTLLEQILASHPDIDGTLELPNILALSQSLRRRARKTNGSGYPEILADLDDAERSEFGRQYIEQTRIHRQGAALFVDKMPNNFRHIGLIHLILPNARIIDIRRHPMAAGFSGFKQLFAEGQEFTYDLADMGNYYRDYVALMDHWDEVLPGVVLRVNYEDLVADLETEVGRILEYCDVPFDEACIEFHRTERSVRTPSSEQVRQPINRSGLDYWRNYAEWLDPLRDALGPDVRARYELN